MNGALQLSAASPLWDLSRTGTRVPQRESRMTTGIGAVFPGLHTPYVLLRKVEIER
jgi:hypothetical protein